MTYRLVTAIIFLFCGTMTALLVRSVLFPEGTGLAAVSTHKAFDYFAARSEGSGLDIWERDAIIGSCRFTPRSGDAKALTKIDKIDVDVDIRVRLPQEVLNSRQVVVGGAVVLHADGMIDDLRLRFTLPGSRPPIELELRQPRGQEWPSMELRQGTTTLVESRDGKITGGVHAWMVAMMLKNVGMSENLFAARASRSSDVLRARAGHVRAGVQTFDGFVLSSSDDEAARFTIYLSNSGEILRIDTPFTGENQLGLRLLSRSLAPKDAVRPVIDKFAP
jgi:hypothetical protein